MARIPTPAQRGQAVGSVQSQFTPTPFQNLNPDADVFGAGQARVWGQAAKGLGALSADITKEVAADDSTELTKFETEVKTYQLGEDARINSLAGQEQQDAAAAAPTAFKTFLAGARSKYKFQLPDSVSAADNFSALSESRFSANATTAFARGKSVVDKQITAARIATAALNLTANPTQVSAYTDVVRSTVLDPNIGQAQASGLDPALINYSGADPKKLAQKGLLENLIAEQEATGLSQTVDAFVARGDYAGAIAFLDSNPALGVNTPGRTATEARVATVRQKVVGQQEFSELVRKQAAVNAVKAGGREPSLAQLQSAIAAESDVNKRARLLTEFSVFSSAKTAVLNEAVRKQGVAFMADLANQVAGPHSLVKYPEFFSRFPDTAVDIATGARQRSVAEATAETAEDKAHINSGGGSATLPGLATQISVLFEKDPIEARLLIESGKLKQYLNREDYAAFRQRAETAKTAETAALAKDPNTASSVMRNFLGYSSADAKSFMTSYGTRMNRAVTAVRQAAIDAGRSVNPDDLRKAVATQIVKVRTADRFDLGTGALDTYDYQAAIEQAKLDEGFDPYGALLGKGSRNDRAVALLFGKATDEVEAAREALDDADKEYTLNNIAAQFGVKTPPDLREAAAKKVAMDNMAVDAGYPSAFIRYVLRGTNRAETEKDNFAAAIQELQSGSVAGASTKKLLQGWASR